MSQPDVAPSALWSTPLDEEEDSSAMSSNSGELLSDPAPLTAVSLRPRRFKAAVNQSRLAGGGAPTDVVNQNSDMYMGSNATQSHTHATTAHDSVVATAHIVPTDLTDTAGRHQEQIVAVGQQTNQGSGSPIIRALNLFGNGRRNRPNPQESPSMPGLDLDGAEPMMIDSPPRTPQPTTGSAAYNDVKALLAMTANQVDSPMPPRRVLSPDVPEHLQMYDPPEGPPPPYPPRYPPPKGPPPHWLARAARIARNNLPMPGILSTITNNYHSPDQTKQPMDNLSIEKNYVPPHEVPAELQQYPPPPGPPPGFVPAERLVENPIRPEDVPEELQIYPPPDHPPPSHLIDNRVRALPPAEPMPMPPENHDHRRPNFSHSFSDSSIPNSHVVDSYTNSLPSDRHLANREGVGRTIPRRVGLLRPSIAGHVCDPDDDVDINLDEQDAAQTDGEKDKSAARPRKPTVLKTEKKSSRQT